MTDRRTSPLANKADVVVTAQVDGLGFTNSYVAPLSLSEVILLSVSGRRDVTDSKRFNRIDSVMERKSCIERKPLEGEPFVNILAIESSCDETAAAVVRDGRTVLSNCVASQIEMHTIYGGVVPEIASRKHVEAVTGLADQAVEQAGLTKGELDAVAVTYGPGLIGAVLVGVNFAKGAAMALDLPPDPGPPCAGAYCRQLHHPPRPGAALRLPVRLRRHHPIGGCAVLYRRWRCWAAPGTMRRGSALTRWPGCWASATPAAVPWTAWRRGRRQPL